MSDSLKRTYGSVPIEYTWNKPKPLLFITHWGDKGDALWISPTYNSGILEKNRGRWGLTNHGAKNPHLWMDRINFKKYNNSIYAVTDINGLEKIQAIESEIDEIEIQLRELHLKLQAVKQKRFHVYKEVCIESSTMVTESDLRKMRNKAAELGQDMVACFKVESEEVDKT
jgi:hypothetical protein